MTKQVVTIALQFDLASFTHASIHMVMKMRQLFLILLCTDLCQFSTLECPFAKILADLTKSSVHEKFLGDLCWCYY